MNDVQGFLEQALAQIGYELVDFEMSGQSRLLRLFIDKPEGITVDDCAIASDHVSRCMAVDCDIDYDRLEVSSPGLNRVLKKEADFKRFMGRKVALRVRMPVNGRRNFEGILTGCEQHIVRLLCDGVPCEFNWDNVDKTRLVPQIFGDKS